MIRVLINKFTFMKDSKQSFKDLVKKMDSLEETQQGKLKGGFSTMSAATLFGYSPLPREMKFDEVNPFAWFYNLKY